MKDFIIKIHEQSNIFKLNFPSIPYFRVIIIKLLKLKCSLSSLDFCHGSFDIRVFENWFQENRLLLLFLSSNFCYFVDLLHKRNYATKLRVGRNGFRFEKDRTKNIRNLGADCARGEYACS